MNIEEIQVRQFYEVIWNQHDKSVVSKVLHETFLFRGSLGAQKQGHKGFIEYLDMIHDALGGYTCIINELVSEQSKVFAKMQFTGLHQGTLMGVEATNKIVTWDGAALFHFKDNKISNLWVLGDVKSLESQFTDYC